MPDTKRLRVHRSLQQQIGAALADELMEFLPPAGWGELARRSDVEFVHQRLDQKITSVEARLDAFIVEVNEKFARINADIADLRADVRSMKRTLVVTAVTMTGSIILGVGGIMVAFLQLAVE